MSDYIKIDERKYWLKCLVNDILGDDGLCDGCKYVDHGACPQCRRIGANEIIKIIDTDVAPVRNGRWVKVYGDHLSMGHRLWTLACSECDRLGNGTPYCPNCGAKMEGGDEDETD